MPHILLPVCLCVSVGVVCHSGLQWRKKNTLMFYITVKVSKLKCRNTLLGHSQTKVWLPVDSVNANGRFLQESTPFPLKCIVRIRKSAGNHTLVCILPMKYSTYESGLRQCISMGMERISMECRFLQKSALFSFK